MQRHGRQPSLASHQQTQVIVFTGTHNGARGTATRLPGSLLWWIYV